MTTSASIFATPLRCSQNNGGVQMTAMNTARKKGTRMELAAFIPAITMIKPARINTVGALNVGFTFLSIGFRPSNFDEFVKSHERGHCEQNEAIWLFVTHWFPEIATSPAGGGL